MAAKRVPQRPILAAALALAVALAALGCSADDAEPPRPDAAPSQSLVEPGPALAVEPVATPGQVVGRLARKDRRRVVQAVSGVAVRWLEDAYLAGRYPRRQFRNSFGVFTRSARAAARSDLGRMTNARIGTRIEGVTPTRVRVRVDLLAVDGRAVSGTARVDTRFRTEGRLDSVFRVTGRLMMTREERRWKVFAYDVGRARVDGRGSAGGSGGDADRNRRDRSSDKDRGNRSSKPESGKRRKDRGGRA